jgi:hypothetical protein
MTSTEVGRQQFRCSRCPPTTATSSSTSLPCVPGSFLPYPGSKPAGSREARDAITGPVLPCFRGFLVVWIFRIDERDKVLVQSAEEGTFFATEQLRLLLSIDRFTVLISCHPRKQTVILFKNERLGPVLGGGGRPRPGRYRSSGGGEQAPPREAAAPKVGDALQDHVRAQPPLQDGVAGATAAGAVNEFFFASE